MERPAARAAEAGVRALRLRRTECPPAVESLSSPLPAALLALLRLPEPPPRLPRRAMLKLLGGAAPRTRLPRRVLPLALRIEPVSLPLSTSTLCCDAPPGDVARSDGSETLLALAAASPRLASGERRCR